MAPAAFHFQASARSSWIRRISPSGSIAIVREDWHTELGTTTGETMAMRVDEKAAGEFTETFRRMGARDPESWAYSELSEGIPQLARFVFLRQAWSAVAKEDDDSWIDHLVAGADDGSEAPFGAVGPAIKRMLEGGVASNDIVDLVRFMQFEILFRVCYQLSDAGVIEGPDGTTTPLFWGLFQLDDQGNAISSIDALHESVLETDPTGREMRPRPRV